MDAEESNSNDLPAFGSTIFNFRSVMNNLWISAHVSVPFIENSMGNEEAPGAQGKGLNEHQPHEAEASDVVKEQKGKAVASTPEAAEKPVESKEKGTSPTAADEETYGWCRIVEEPMED